MINGSRCYGSAIQAGIIAGDVASDIVLLDVTPLTLGIETLGGVREPLMKEIPQFLLLKVFHYSTDNQTAVTIHVVQVNAQWLQIMFLWETQSN